MGGLEIFLVAWSVLGLIALLYILIPCKGFEFWCTEVADAWDGPDAIRSAFKVIGLGLLVAVVAVIGGLLSVAFFGFLWYIGREPPPGPNY